MAYDVVETDVSAEQAAADFDADCRRYLSMSGDEFAALVARGGRLPAHPMAAHLLLYLGAPAGT